MPTTQAAMGFLDGSGFFAVLFFGLAAAAALGAYVWRKTGTSSAKLTTLGAASLMACSALWAAFSGLFRLGDLDPRLWVAPFDRLLLVVSVIALTWTLTAGTSRSRRWRSLLTGGIAASLLLYLHWATLWARELHRHPTLTYDPTGLARAWDIGLVVMAVALAIYLWRFVPRAPRWLAIALGGLAVGSLLEVVAPVSPVVPVWSRFGALLAGAVFAGAALVQTVDLHGGFDGPVGRLDLRRLRRRAEAESAHRPAQVDPLPELGLGVAPGVLSDQTLLVLAEHLGAEPGIVGLLTQDGDFDVRAMATPRSEPRRLGSLPLSDHPTLRRVLHEGALSLASSRLAPDVDRLYRLAGFNNTGPVLLQRIGTVQAHGVLVAGRKGGHWDVAQQSAIGAIARRVGVALDAAARAKQSPAGAGAGSHAALAAQATALNRLTNLVEGVGQRVERIEKELDGDAPAAGAPAPGTPAPDSATPDTVAADVVTRDTPASELAATEVATVDGWGATAVPELPGVDAETAEPHAGNEVGLPDSRSEQESPHGDEALDAPETPADPESADPASEIAESADDHDSTGALANVADASEQLSARVPRYERALERLPWAVVVVDAVGQVAFANEAAADLLHRDEVAPGMPFASALPAPERMVRALNQMRREAEAGSIGQDSGPSDVEVRFDAPDVRVELEPLSDPDAGYIGAVAVIHPAAAQPEGVGTQLVPELTDALRAPMSSILGYSDLLTRGPGVPEEQLGRFLHRIDANLARMQVMLSNLLTVIEIDDEAVQTEPVDVNQVVEIAVGRARAQFEEKGLDVRCAITDLLPPASAEPEALQQIVDNLLVNAALRSPQGGDVTVGAEIRTLGDAQTIVISVHDRGSRLKGAPSGVVEIDGADAAPVALRIVRLLAARQGGRAWAESDRHGAKFYVRLPVRRAA